MVSTPLKRHQAFTAKTKGSIFLYEPKKCRAGSIITGLFETYQECLCKFTAMNHPLINKVPEKDQSYVKVKGNYAHYI